jgi:hypothetical protein
VCNDHQGLALKLSECLVVTWAKEGVRGVQRNDWLRCCYLGLYLQMAHRHAGHGVVVWGKLTCSTVELFATLLQLLLLQPFVRYRM